jgi:LDH2 family malate/lactate/ureidoglycolate dehydrogenase
MKISIDQASKLARDAMVAVGHSTDEATAIAHHLIDCELRGLSYGGLPRALSIAEHIRNSGAERRPIAVLRESLVSASLDGGGQVGYLVANRAVDMAINKARQTGLAVVGASKTWYTGMFSYYLERITQAGFVGMLAGSGGPKVAPHGGTQGRFSTSPIAFGFPSEPVPVIWDIGTSNVMLAEVLLAQRLGQQLPEGHAFDAKGQPTCEPAEALTGAFTVWGGHKGSGLAMTVHLLAMLAGQEMAPGHLKDCGFFCLVVDPELMGPADEFKARVSAYADSLRATRPIDPERPVRVPFERSFAERASRRTGGVIEVADPVYEALHAFVAGAPTAV